MRVDGPESVNTLPTTLTTIVELADPKVAVTVIARFVGSPAVDNCAVATPAEFVIPADAVVEPEGTCGAILPEVAANCTCAFGTTLLFRSRTSVVIVIGALPSEGICGELVLTVNDA